MIKALLFDFSRTLLFPKDNQYVGSLNELYRLKRDEINFNFFNYFELNDRAIDLLKPLKDKYKLAIFTSDSIQNDPAIYNKLSSVFIKIYSAKEIGFSKSDPKAYELIANDLNLSPDEIVFIDDSKVNIDTASIAKLDTITYIGFNELVESFKERGISPQ